MTESDASNVTPLSDKLSQVTHHHLFIRVPVKLELENWNYRSWEFFSDQLCCSYDVAKYIHGVTNDIGSNALAPLTPEELKVDKIVLSWIFTTLSDPLQARLVVARPKSAKEAWDLISNIVKDNKRSRTNSLKAKLRTCKLGDQSMEAYFQKLELISTILTSLKAVNDKDLVCYAIKCLSDMYDQVCGIMHHKDTFLDFKIAQCRFVHDNNAKSGDSSRPKSKNNKMDDLLVQLLTKLGVNDPATPTVSTKSGTTTSKTQSSNGTPVAYHTTSPTGPSYFAPPHFGPYVSPYTQTPSYASPIVPLEFYYPPVHPFYPAQQLLVHQPALAQVGSPAELTSLAHQPGNTPLGLTQLTQSTNALGQATSLPHAFITGTLHDPSTWNMDTEKPPVLCHACQRGKHVRLPFASSNTVVTSRFDIIHLDVWTSLISSLSDANIVCCMWLFHHKYHANGTLSRYKAHLVANGTTQLEGVDVDEIFSLVVKPGTIQTVLSLAAS
uniref:Hybrid signal transduction histidine kinase M n=1 Tax=Tanacetum cinerariifolium TaxID=118510 RepID=A0A6L2KS33_TANCI|nr:hybrid signal transduction histidine kinase M [Tanacetum cinerariifolium]